jgi:hypothetical protein
VITWLWPASSGDASHANGSDLSSNAFIHLAFSNACDRRCIIAGVKLRRCSSRLSNVRHVTGDKWLMSARTLSLLS